MAELRAVTDRLFFAVFPDVDAALRIAQLGEGLRCQHHLRGKALATERLHVSLHHVGDFARPPDRGMVAAARDIAAGVHLPSFAVEFNGAMSFRGRRDNQPFVLHGDDGVIGLAMLQQALGAAMEKAGLGRCAMRYNPHITLMYADRFVADRAVDPVRWTVHEFVLVHSLLGRSRYLALERFALG
jgi:RNA 2',3'-cyclic 3'-phosphodiesterase